MQNGMKGGNQVPIKKGKTSNFQASPFKRLKPQNEHLITVIFGTRNGGKGFLLHDDIRGAMDDADKLKDMGTHGAQKRVIADRPTEAMTRALTHGMVLKQW